MQYQAEVLPYKRTTKVKRENKGNGQLQTMGILKTFTYFIMCFLISRVLLLNMDNTTAPFGITFLIVICMYKDEFIIPSSAGCFLGYISLYSKLSNLPQYLIAVSIITALSYLLSKNSRKFIITFIFSAVFLELVLSEFFIGNLTLKVAFLVSFLQMICIVPLYFILEKSILCIEKFKTKHLFSSEEIISIAILISLTLSGTWGIMIRNVSLRNILALTFILILSYINGSTIGAASGIAIGSIIGISSNNLIIFISVYGLCGFVAGIFKETGRVLTGFSYVITFLILKLYSNIGLEFKIQEIMIAALIFFIIPKKIYERANLELDWEKKQEYLSKNYIDKIKDMLIQRLNNFSDVLYNISGTLANLSYNDKLVMKSKSTALVENLADRVCGNCNMKFACWKKEGYCTYAAFGELIGNYEKGRKNRLPKEIERKCIKRTILLRNTEQIVNNYIINEMWRKRLSEGREVLANQINSMSGSLKEIICEFNSDIKLDTEIEKRTRKILSKSSIKYKDVFCYRNKDNRLTIKLNLDSCGGSGLCAKQILPLINEAVDKHMCVGDEGCVIDPKTKVCTATFEESPKFYVASYVARQCKQGEKYNGDSYSFGKVGDGSYMCIISDGMGSGPEASEESKAAVELIEKFTNAGLSKATAINTVNSIMSLKFSEEEKFSTLDLNSLNLYTGDISFMKVGAVASFIKSGNKVDVIRSKTLPIGVLDKVDLDIINKKVKNGDIILMLSDGVLDYDNNSVGKVDWIVDYLIKTNINNPKELVEDILSKAKELSGGKVKDDMTAIVSKVYSLY